MNHTRASDATIALGDEAGRVLARTRAAARRLGHTRLGTEHLLLGLLDEPRGLAAALLHRAGIDQEKVEAAIMLVAPMRTAEPSAEFVMAPSLRRVLRLAPDEARRLGDDEVRSEHLLLAMLREGTGHGAVVLGALHANLQLLRVAVARERPGGRHVSVASGWVARGPYRLVGWLGDVALLAAIATMIWWLVAIPSLRRVDYLYLLLIPLVLVGFGLVAVGSSRLEAQRAAHTAEMLLEAWRAQRTPVLIEEALHCAEGGDLAAARAILARAVSHPVPAPEYRAALAALAPWLAHEAWRPLALSARGWLHLHADRLDLASADVTQALQRQPDDAELHHLLGTIQRRAGRPVMAAEAYREACRLRPENGTYWMDLAVALLRQGAFAEAESAARQAVELAPDLASTHATSAAVACLRGALDQAEHEVGTAMTLSPHEWAAQAVRAGVFLQRGLPERALEVAQAAAATVYGESSPLLAALEGWAYAASGHAQEARAALADARSRDPDLAACGRRLAQALDTLGQREAAAYLRARAAELAG